MNQNHLGWRFGLFLLMGGSLVLPGAGFAPASADVTRAIALAQAGALDAEAKLKAYFPVHTFDSLTLPKPYRFWGSDATETTEPYPTTRPETALNPSFAVEVDNDPTNTDPTPRTMKINGSALGYSGAPGPGTYAANGDHYTLKVSDLSGRIHVNDGIENGPTGSVSQNLKRILNVLGQVLGENLLGDRILAGRPAGGYVNLSDLLPALGSEQSFAAVRDFVTVRAWVDRNVANPVPLSVATLPYYPVQYSRGAVRVLRYSSSVNSSGLESNYYDFQDTIPSAGLPTSVGPQASALYGLDTLNPQWIEIVGRAPVNINTASREVLVALLSNLRGFYVAERKRNNARWEGDSMVVTRLESHFSAGTLEGSEYGYLTETYPIAGPGGGLGISPYLLADEIIACRKKINSASAPYATLPWAGPFRSWHQFNLFVDNLVATGVLSDPRDIHKAYQEEGVDPTGFGALVGDNLARLQAARAIGDVLKANFNPNLHLNELNPDANLHLRVDKTDLFVNSTEFCFVPTGYFEVESVGRVVKPLDTQTDALTASDNRLMAQASITATFQLYDLYRETTQKQFYAGTLTARTSLIETNNESSLEIGPEPDNGVFPGNLGAAGTADNEWDGYIALPTVGGPQHLNPGQKPKNTLVHSLDYPANPQFGATMHAHFAYDADACDHPFDRQEIAGRTLAEEEVSNYPSQVVGVPLPYGRPNDLAKGSHRLARSFRISGGATPVLTPAAPSDMRIDGIYCERNCAPAYYAHKGTSHLWDFNTTLAKGMVGFWLKPSFYPESTGKIRKFWDMGRHHSPCSANINVWPFGLFFMPVHYNHDTSDLVGPQSWALNIGKFQSCSMWFGSKQWHTDDQFTTGNAHEFGKVTSCLNHIGNSDETMKPNPLQGHRWINVAFSWGLNGTQDFGGNLSKLYINGTASYTKYSYVSMSGFGDGLDRMNGFNKHSGGAYNQMRIGGTSLICDAARAVATNTGSYRGNYSSDATLDEVYTWPNDGFAPDLLWSRGRYYTLRGQTNSEGLFTSQTIALPPAGGVGATPVKVLGSSWTWYGEDADAVTGNRVLWDYGGNLTGTPSRDTEPAVELSVIDGGGLTYGPFSDDGFSPVLSLAGTTPDIQNPSQVHYAAHFRLGAPGTPILLGTPVLDDVTIYWSDGRASTRVDTSTPLSITNPSTLPDGDRGTPYVGTTFTASSGGPVTWSATGVPPGLSLDPATGVYGGTPTSGGQYTVVVTASSGGLTSTASYPQLITGAPASSGGGGGGGGGGCGLLGAEAALMTVLLRLLARRR